MKRVLQVAAALPLLAFAAHAQNQDDMRLHEKLSAEIKEAMQVKVAPIGSIRGMTVKGAPYSGEEVNETNHTLADGTRIHRETRAMVYRDSEGRTRRETPENIIINDPVAGATYILNPKTMTAQKLAMGVQNFTFLRKEGGSAAGSQTTTATFTMKMESDGGTPLIVVNGETLDPKQVQELIAKAKASGEQIGLARSVDHAIVAENLVVERAVAGAKAGAMVGSLPRKMAGESLGKQTIEGVNAEGMRTVNTIKAGTIGNDRDIQVTGESWYSPELQMTISSKHSDPRSGEESFRVVNINRNEPAAYLFQVPSGYTIADRK